MRARKPSSWRDWYRFAQTLGCTHDEAVEYANCRVVEDANRASLRAAAA